MSEPRTCLDCQHFQIDRGYDATRKDPGCPDTLGCKISDNTGVWQDIFKLENPAEACTFLDPIIANNWGYCRKPIDILRYQCKHQLNHWYPGDAIALCSIASLND